MAGVLIVVAPGSRCLLQLILTTSAAPPPPLCVSLPSLSPLLTRLFSTLYYPFLPFHRWLASTPFSLGWNNLLTTQLIRPCNYEANGP